MDCTSETNFTKVVGVLNCYQILRHIFSCNSPSGGVLCPAFTTTTNGQIGILQAVGKIFISGFLSSGRGFRQFVGCTW
jgi:hypothetical protein